MAHTVTGGGLMRKLETVKNLSIQGVKEMRIILRLTKNVRITAATPKVSRTPF